MNVIPVDLTPDRSLPPLLGFYQIELLMACMRCHRSDYYMKLPYTLRMLSHQEIWPCCCGEAMSLMCAPRSLKVGTA